MAHPGVCLNLHFALHRLTKHSPVSIPVLAPNNATWRLNGVVTDNSPYPIHCFVRPSKSQNYRHEATRHQANAVTKVNPVSTTGAERVTSTKYSVEANVLLRHFWKSAVGFWGKSGTRSSWLLSGIIFLILLVNLATTYGMNAWTRAIFDALQNRDSATILFLSIIYLLLVAAMVSLTVVDVYARMTTQRRWRAWLNNHLI